MRQAIIDLGAARRRGTQPGLLLQKYLTRHSDPAERRALLDAAREAAQSVALRSVYADAFSRWERSFSSGKPFRSERLATPPKAARLIVGLGSASILETGLRLHHTYGVPIIPGSALKGLASHYCDDVWGQRHDPAAPEENRRFRADGRADRGRDRDAEGHDGEAHRLLFGTTDDGGVITFHDAWIVPESLSAALRLDVMTPHHLKWQTNAAPPTDFDSPNPVSFLSVEGAFDVRLSWSGPASTPGDLAERWTGLAMQILQEALDHWGVGGKTSSGYGRLVAVGSRPDRDQPSGLAKPAAETPAKRIQPPKPGEKVEAQLLEERTKKDGWKALHVPSGLSGVIENSRDVPADKKAGDTLELILKSAKGQESGFRYPTPADEARAQRSPGRGQGGPAGGRRR